MSVKKHLRSLCKFYSFYEEIPEEFFDETDVDSYFYHNIFDISLSQHRKVRVGKGSNKKSFAIKLPTSVTFFGAITICSTDCAYDNSAIIIIGDAYCPNTKCGGILCLHKKTFQFLGISDY